MFRSFVFLRKRIRFIDVGSKQKNVFFFFFFENVHLLRNFVRKFLPLHSNGVRTLIYPGCEILFVVRVVKAIIKTHQ